MSVTPIIPKLLKTKSIVVSCMLNSFLLVILGGALGSGLRFSISKIFTPTTEIFTYVSLVNIIGCFVAGFAAACFDRYMVHDNMRLFLVTGILGGFTTFSAFSLDALNLINKGKTLEAMIYISISVVVSMVAVILGYKIFYKI